MLVHAKAQVLARSPWPEGGQVPPAPASGAGWPRPVAPGRALHAVGVGSTALDRSREAL